MQKTLAFIFMFVYNVWVPKKEKSVETRGCWDFQGIFVEYVWYDSGGKITYDFKSH